MVLALSLGIVLRQVDVTPGGAAARPYASSTGEHSHDQPESGHQSRSCDMPAQLPCCAGAMSCSLMLDSADDGVVGFDLLARFGTVSDREAPASPIMSLEPPPPRV